MPGGKRESHWSVIRRCLAVIQRVQRGPASRDELIRAVLAQEGPEAYGESRDEALYRRLETYRDALIEEQRRADLWEREMVGIIEALVALQEKLDAGLTFEDKRALVEMLVKGIVIETCTDEAGKHYSKAYVTYRFERPDVSQAPIPIELEPLFTRTEMATNWLNLGTGI